MRLRAFGTTLTQPPPSGEDAFVMTPSPFATASTSPATLPLTISLIFGVGQCVVGAGLLVRALRAHNWQRPALFVSGVLGAWAICSGMAELVVSGFTAFSLSSRVAGPSALSGVRHAADTALLVASGVLVLPLLVYPFWRRLRARRPVAERVRPVRED